MEFEAMVSYLNIKIHRRFTTQYYTFPPNNTLLGMKAIKNDYDTHVMYDIEKVDGKFQTYVSHHLIDLSTVLIPNDGSLEELSAVMEFEAMVSYLNIKMHRRFTTQYYTFPPNNTLLGMKAIKNDYDTHVMYDIEKVDGKFQTYVSHHPVDLSTVLIPNDGSLEELSACIISKETKIKQQEPLSEEERRETLSDSVFKHDLRKLVIAKMSTAITYDSSRGTKSGEERFKEFANNTDVVDGERFRFNTFRQIIDRHKNIFVPSRTPRAPRAPPTAPMAKSLASHISSKGKSQLGAIKIGASVDFNTLFEEEERGIFFKKTGHRPGYLRKILYESSIEAVMPKETTDTLDGSGKSHHTSLERARCITQPERHTTVGPKEDPAYYPADRGNNDDDESSNDDDDDDDVEKD
nr:hypothetical protein [Tanacetum cinerariifolium]